MTPTAIVTGASSGIGRAIALQLAADGICVVAVARRAERLADLAAEASARQLSGRIIPLARDVTEERAAVEAVTLAVGYGPLQWLVNNAGMARFGEFRRADIGSQLQTVDLNCKAAMAFTAAALPRLLQQDNAHVVNIASLSAFAPMPFFGITYAASKSFLLSFSEGLSEELRGSGVSVTVVCPGAVETEFDLLAAPQVRRKRQWDEITAEQCAVVAIDAARRGRVVAFKGVRWKASALLVKLMPRWLVRRDMARRRGSVVGFPREMQPQQASAADGSAAVS